MAKPFFSDDIIATAANGRKARFSGVNVEIAPHVESPIFYGSKKNITAAFPNLDIDGNYPNTYTVVEEQASRRSYPQIVRDRLREAQSVSRGKWTICNVSLDFEDQCRSVVSVTIGFDSAADAVHFAMLSK